MLDNLLEGAKFLFENKHYADSAKILDIVTKYINDKIILDKIYTNIRMCYFLANDVPKALHALELQEQLHVNYSFEIKRDKANFLRYMNRHQEAYTTALEIEDDKTRNLALSWFKHKEGKTLEAFYLTEQSRKNDYWWKKMPNYKFSLWDGSKVDNLVVVEESGFGDQIIFSRWIPELKKLCNKLYYDGNALSTTFMRNFDIESINNFDKNLNIYAVPIMSLAYFLKIEKPENNIYLTPDKNLVANYNEKYPKSKKRIGLCVQGEKTHVETTLRTLPIRAMIDNLKEFGEIVNLQKEIDHHHREINYIPFNTWEDTLALIDTCDLVVTCDTSVSHAAAAMGKCTIVLMHAAAYFTWNHNFNISKSAWYYDAWCIHQDLPCDWTGSIENCKQLINKLLYENSVSKL